MDAAVKMYRLIDCGDVLNGSRDGIVQMRVRNKCDRQIAAAGMHILNCVLYLMPITLIYRI